MVEIQPIRVELEREEDGRILASVPDLPGVMAYAATEEEAVRKVKSIALQPMVSSAGCILNRTWESKMKTPAYGWRIVAGGRMRPQS